MVLTIVMGIASFLLSFIVKKAMEKYDRLEHEAQLYYDGLIHYREKYEETVVAMDDQFFLMEEAYTEIQNLCIKNQELTNRLSVYNN